MKQSINQKIIDKANTLGFEKVGFSKADFYEQDEKALNVWIDKGYNASMKWIENRKEERSNIFKYFPDAKTVISFGCNYYTGEGSGHISEEYNFSNYAWGDDYHDVIKKNLYELVEFMRQILGDFNYRVCVDTSPLMEKKWAMRSGLGWIGKNTNLITRDFGSWIFLSEIIIDKKLEVDDFFDMDLCGTCTACIDDCPTDAIIEPYTLDSSKCISYLTIEHRGDIPEDNKKSLNNWIYGCDICQEVCPWNIKFSKISNKKSFQIRDGIKDKKKIKDWQIDKEEFNQIFKKSSVKRTKYEGLMRNIDLVEN